MQKLKYFISIILISLLNFSCEEKSRSNPFDPDTDLDPSEWAPTNLQAQVLNDSQIRLTWEQEVTQIEGFRIDRQKDRGSWIQIKEVSDSANQYLDNNVNNTDNGYLYRVYAYANDKISYYSNLAAPSIMVTDIDGNAYNSVKIGTQWWITENLKVTHYRNGDVIPHKSSSSNVYNLATGAYYYYNDIVDNATMYGNLYNWYAVNDISNIAPEGWHVPSDTEWEELVEYLGGANEASGKLKEIGTTHWNSPNIGATNESGFSALPGGMFEASDSSFIFLGEYASIWSLTEHEQESNEAWYMGIGYFYLGVDRSYRLKKCGMSVRCIKD